MQRSKTIEDLKGTPRVMETIIAATGTPILSESKKVEGPDIETLASQGACQRELNQKAVIVAHASDMVKSATTKFVASNIANHISA